MPVGCEVGIVPFPVLYFYSCLFLASMLCLLIVAALLHQRLKRRSPQERWVWNSPHDSTYMAMLIGFEVTFIQFVEMTLKLFNCRYEGADGSGRLVMATDTPTACFEGVRAGAVALAIPLFLLHLMVGAGCVVMIFAFIALFMTFLNGAGEGVRSSRYERGIKSSCLSGAAHCAPESPQGRPGR